MPAYLRTWRDDVARLHDRRIKDCKYWGERSANLGIFAVKCFVREALGLLAHMATCRSSSGVLVPPL
jgi:hypothetical protein